jgi:hypothetical protein
MASYLAAQGGDVMRRWSLVVLIGLVGCAGAAPMTNVPVEARRVELPPEPAAAEYAVRWKVQAGGPQTGQEALDVLGLESADDEERLVRYFTVRKPADAPGDFDAILRQRINEKEKSTTEVTFTYRGKRPIAPPRCPLPAFDEEKSEVDVSFVSAAETSRAFSYSCEVTAAGPAKALRARPAGCTAWMGRLEAPFASGTVKFEEWRIPRTRPKADYIEVSFGGRNDPDDALAFRTVVEALIGQGIRPVADGMTALTMACGRKKR